MGKVKEIYTELQEMFGYYLEDMPSEFSVDEYFAMRANEMEKQRLASYEKPALIEVAKIEAEVFEPGKQLLIF